MTNVRNSKKDTVYKIAKYTGLFQLCRLLTRNEARILCYHGLEIEDECAYVPGLFISPEVFAQRLEKITALKFNVITLQELYTHYNNKRIPRDTLVITFDDGFYSTYKFAVPALAKANFPSTLYLTSFYYNDESPVFPLALRYLFWKSNVPPESVKKSLENHFPDAPLSTGESMIEALCDYGQSRASNSERNTILSVVAQAVGIDLDELLAKRQFSLIDEDELKHTMASGMNIELHTHRHHFPENADTAAYEITKNKQKVEPILGHPMTHFCYPSGVWSKTHWSMFESMNVHTATTCESGLINPETPQYAWGRILDSARISDIAFEAELMGFDEIVRRIRALFRRR